jgi:hypothetical protein
MVSVVEMRGLYSQVTGQRFEWLVGTVGRVVWR